MPTYRTAEAALAEQEVEEDEEEEGVQKVNPPTFFEKVDEVGRDTKKAGEDEENKERKVEESGGREDSELQSFYATLNNDTIENENEKESGKELGKEISKESEKEIEIVTQGMSKTQNIIKKSESVIQKESTVKKANKK